MGTPIQPPPGIALIDKICIAADQRERQQAQQAQAPDMTQMMAVMMKMMEMQSLTLRALTALVMGDDENKPKAKAEAAGGQST
jgi:hypothetical protein